MNRFTIAVITDLHGASSTSVAARRGEIADQLLGEAIARLNTLHRPDVTVTLGDIVDSGDTEDAIEWLGRLRSIFEQLHSPFLAIPGNHDPDPDRFYREFAKPSPIVEIKGVRFLSFVDPGRPGYNSERTASELERIEAAREGFDGAIVALQHVCLFPNGTADIPYNYINSTQIIEKMKEYRVCLSVSGHYHRGSAAIASRGVTYLVVPALCEFPHPYLLVTLTGEDSSPTVEIERYELRGDLRKLRDDSRPVVR